MQLQPRLWSTHREDIDGMRLLQKLAANKVLSGYLPVAKYPVAFDLVWNTLPGMPPTKLPMTVSIVAFSGTGENAAKAAVSMSWRVTDGRLHVGGVRVSCCLKAQTFCEREATHSAALIWLVASNTAQTSGMNVRLLDSMPSSSLCTRAVAGVNGPLIRTRWCTHEARC